MLKLKENYEVEVIMKPDFTMKNGKFEVNVVKTYNDEIEKIRKQSKNKK